MATTHLNVLHFLFAWPNAPFTIAAGVAVIFALLQEAMVDKLEAILVELRKGAQ